MKDVDSNRIVTRSESKLINRRYCFGYLASIPWFSESIKQSYFLPWSRTVIIFSTPSAGSGDDGDNTCSCNQQVNYLLVGTSNVRTNITTDERCCDCCRFEDTCLGYTTVGSNENNVTCTTFTSVSGLTATPVSGSDVSTAFLCKQNCSTLSKSWWLQAGELSWGAADVSRCLTPLIRITGSFEPT